MSSIVGWRSSVALTVMIETARGYYPRPVKRADLYPQGERYDRRVLRAFISVVVVALLLIVATTTLPFATKPFVVKPLKP